MKYPTVIKYKSKFSDVSIFESLIEYSRDKSHLASVTVTEYDDFS